jgi:hypothetical protein
LANTFPDKLEYLTINLSKIQQAAGSLVIDDLQNVLKRAGSG